MSTANIIDAPEALVAYLDILGYKAAINNQSVDKLIYYKAIDDMVSGLNAIPMYSGFKEIIKIKNYISVNIFSDSIIFVFDQANFHKFELRSDGIITSAALFNIFAYLISFFVHDCLRQINHLCRGAIVRGQCYRRELENLAGNHFIFSKALCDAHTNAESIADTPRILVHNSVLQAINDVAVLFCRNANPQNSLLIDSDGLYYLNVYKCFLDNPKAAFSTSRCLAEILKQCLKNNNDPPYYRHRRKWNWFIKYHNDMMSKMVSFSKMCPTLGYGDFETNIDSLIVKDENDSH